MALKILKYTIIVIWIVLLGLLIKRNLRPAEIEILNTQGREAAIDERDDWMGVYYQGNKIGYSNSVRRIIEGGYSFNQTSYFRFPILGVVQDIYLNGITITDSTFKPETFKVDVESGRHHFSLFGKVEGNKLRLQTTTVGKPTERLIELDDDFALPATFESMLSNRGLEIGQKFSSDIFDPVTMAKTNVSAEVVGMDTLEIMSEKQSAYKLKMLYQNNVAHTWVNEKGQVLKEQSSMGLMMIKETKEKALKLPPHSEIAGYDLAVAVSIPSNVIMENPREVTHMQVELFDADFSEFVLEGENQKIISQEDSSIVLEIDHKIPDFHPEFSFPIVDSSFAQWLKPEILIQSDDEKIIEKARKIVGSEKTLWEAADKTRRWVYEQVKKRPVPSVPSALDVLETLEGDCNEHTVLMTALMRSLGVPTKAVAGIVYLEGAFYYHAWVEVWDGRSWIAVDPTFGSQYADATHIRLVEGGLENYIPLLKIIGKVKLKVIKYE